MLKKVALACEAMHLPIIVFPVPGGPNYSNREKLISSFLQMDHRDMRKVQVHTRRIPLGGRRSPLNSSGRIIGHITASLMIVFA